MAPNPASVYCIDLGGRLEIVKTSKGEVGICHLPDGTVVEEWDLYYQDFQSEEYLLAHREKIKPILDEIARTNECGT